MVLEPLRARRAARLSSSVRRRRRRRGRFRTSNYRDRPRAVANVAQKVCRSSEIGKLRLLSPGALRRCKTYPGPSSIFKVLLLLQGGALVELLGTQGASRSGWDVFPRTQCPVVMRNDTVSWGYRYIRCAIGVVIACFPTECSAVTDVIGGCRFRARDDANRRRQVLASAGNRLCTVA